MEAHYHHKKKKKKKKVVVTFFTELRDINSQLWVIKSELPDINNKLRFKVQSRGGGGLLWVYCTSPNSEKKSQNCRKQVWIARYKLAILRKSQKCELISRSSDFIFSELQLYVSLLRVFISQNCEIYSKLVCLSQLWKVAITFYIFYSVADMGFHSICRSFHFRRKIYGRRLLKWIAQRDWLWMPEEHICVSKQPFANLRCAW